MDETRARDVLVAALAVSAVVLTAVAAVPLFSDTQGDDATPGVQETEANSSGGQFVPASEFPMGTVLAVLIVFAGMFVTAQFVDEPWETLEQFASTVVGVGVLLGAGLALLTLLRSESVPEAPSIADPTNRTWNNTGGFGRGETAPLALPADSLPTLVLVTGVLGALTFLVWKSGVTPAVLATQARDDGDASSDTLASVSQVAGDAAERVETASSPAAADNTIYRAWEEMVSLFGASDPQETTPRQFERRAIDAGMDPRSVRVLTRTFEEVRYGDATLSEERRERAVSALRRIEETHGEQSSRETAPDGHPDRGNRTDGGDSE